MRRRVRKPVPWPATPARRTIKRLQMTGDHHVGVVDGVPSPLKRLSLGDQPVRCGRPRAVLRVDVHILHRRTVTAPVLFSSTAAGPSAHAPHPGPPTTATHPAVHHQPRTPGRHQAAPLPGPATATAPHTACRGGANAQTDTARHAACRTRNAPASATCRAWYRPGLFSSSFCFLFVLFSFSGSWPWPNRQPGAEATTATTADSAPASLSKSKPAGHHAGGAENPSPRVSRSTSDTTTMTEAGTWGPSIRRATGRPNGWTGGTRRLGRLPGGRPAELSCPDRCRW